MSAAPRRLRTLLWAVGLGASATTGALFVTTRKCAVRPVPADDAIYASPAYARLNPHRNPSTHDEVVRRVPLSSVRPELLNEDGRLAEAFCGGVFGGIVYEVQRRYLARKYRGPLTASQLWEREAIQTSRFLVGTLVTDHFEVVARTPESVTLRCGDTPRAQEVRPSDGLFEVSASVDEERGEVEVRLKSVFFQGLGKAEGAPMPAWIKSLHVLYTMWLAECGVRSLVK